MSGEGSSREQVNHLPGIYCFTVHPGLQDDATEITGKNVEFIYCKTMDCLYVKRESLCPFGIYTSGVPPENCKIKIVVYTEDNIAVMRCRNHAEGKIKENTDFVSPLHFMRSRNDLAVYEACGDTGELSISLPYIKPEGVEENVENLVFLCSTKSCIKKETFIKFSLMNSDKILGYHEFRIHVCSTPGRDRINHIAAKTGTRKRRRKMREDADKFTETVIPSGSQLQEQTFVVQVEKEWIYQYLSKINRGLELLEAVPYEDQEKYLRRHRAKLASSSKTASTCTASSASSSSDTRYTFRRILVKS